MRRAFVVFLCAGCGSSLAARDASGDGDAPADGDVIVDASEAVEAGDAGERADAPSDTASDADAGTDAAFGDGACNTLVLPPQVTAMHSPSMAPTPTGGSIVDGTYVMTAMTVYDGKTGPYGKYAFAADIGGSTWQVVHDLSGFTQKLTFTVSTSQAKLTLFETCSGPYKEVDDYSADAQHVHIFARLFNDTIELLLTKQ